ncbi:hypothetical protein G5V57_24175 [Nordella sp. HKS 07]|uniref:hypothetical protein n=1 Tax=Nordella sp. HKS 07 TaxID=2712222 RepID=UPI0013E1DFDC|nr:hypothetical protein [Nordella sp. HKS 07]QIG50552.1 hypothetical protein G5V57_24175 [Nordella sp. HKS 07]
MTPFDKDVQDQLVTETRPELPFDENVAVVDPLELAHRQLKDATERENRLNAEIAALRRLVGGHEDKMARMRRTIADYHEREQQMAGTINRDIGRSLVDVDRVLQRQPRVYPTGLGGVGHCDCTMDRASLIQRVVRTLRGGPGD